MNVEVSGQSLPSSSQTAVRGDRVARTREAIVSSTLTLAQNGEVAPIVRDIAKLAGVSARTVFQHFADTAELYVAVLGRVLVTLIGESPDLNRQWPLDQRIAVVVGQRAERYEPVRPMWTFIQTLQRRSAEAAAKILEFYAGNREQIADSFSPELSALAGDKRERTLNALALALTPESWIVLRERLGLTVEQAREEWHFIVKAVFSDDGGR
jgi:AcrR family transcriptional regulator